MYLLGLWRQTCNKYNRGQRSKFKQGHSLHYMFEHQSMWHAHWFGKVIIDCVYPAFPITVTRLPIKQDINNQQFNMYKLSRDARIYAINGRKVQCWEVAVTLKHSDLDSHLDSQNSYLIFLFGGLPESALASDWRSVCCSASGSFLLASW